MQLLLDRTSAKILFILDLFHKQHKDPIFPSWCIIAPLTVGQCVTAEKRLRLHCRHVSALTPVAPENQSRRNKYCARNWLKAFYLSWKADKKKDNLQARTMQWILKLKACGLWLFLSLGWEQEPCRCWSPSETCYSEVYSDLKFTFTSLHLPFDR